MRRGDNAMCARHKNVGEIFMSVSHANVCCRAWVIRLALTWKTRRVQKPERRKGERREESEKREKESRVPVNSSTDLTTIHIFHFVEQTILYSWSLFLFVCFVCVCLSFWCLFCLCLYNHSCATFTTQIIYYEIFWKVVQTFIIIRHPLQNTGRRCLP